MYCITSSVSASVFSFASPPSGPSFGSLSNQSAPSFGSLAQQGSGFGSQPSSFSGFGQQPQAGGETAVIVAPPFFPPISSLIIFKCVLAHLHLLCNSKQPDQLPKRNWYSSSIHTVDLYYYVHLIFVTKWLFTTANV